MNSPQLLALALALAMFPLVGYMIYQARYEYKQKNKPVRDYREAMVGLILDLDPNSKQNVASRKFMADTLFPVIKLTEKEQE